MKYIRSTNQLPNDIHTTCMSLLIFLLEIVSQTLSNKGVLLHWKPIRGRQIDFINVVVEPGYNFLRQGIAVGGRGGGVG